MTAMVHADNAYSLRTQLAIARWGKGARHPLCLAAISLWSIEEELRKISNDIALLKGDVGNAELLRRVKEQYWLLVYNKLHTVALARFESALDVANIKAFRAYKRLKKQCCNGSSEAHLTNGQKRDLGILGLLRDKVIKAAWTKGGYVAGWMEVAFGGDRPLSDESWQGRLTAREVYSHFVAAGVFNGNGAKKREELHEIRRAATRLGIRLAEDRRGAKHKSPYLLKPKTTPPPNGLPVGRPREKFDIIQVAESDVIQSVEWKKKHGIRPREQMGATKRFWSHGLWNEREELKSRIVNEVEFYRCPEGRDWRTLRKSYEPEPEPQGRTPVFKAWMDSLANVRYPRWMISRMVEWERYQLRKSVTRSREDDLSGKSPWVGLIELRGGPARRASMASKSEAANESRRQEAGAKPTWVDSQMQAKTLQKP
jgi:hypothetical protein